MVIRTAMKPIPFEIVKEAFKLQNGFTTEKNEEHRITNSGTLQYAYEENDRKKVCKSIS